MIKTSKKHIFWHYLILVFCIGAGIALDQWTKYMAVIHLKESNVHTVVLWNHVLQLTYLENRGAAWGVGQGMSMAFFVLGVIVLIVLAAMYVKIPFQKHYIPMRICIVFFVCGAVGNMIDRIRQGYVVDFIEFGFVNFPVFNVADIYVTCAAAMILIFGLFFYKERDYEIFSFSHKCSTKKDEQ